MTLECNFRNLLNQGHVLHNSISIIGKILSLMILNQKYVKKKSVIKKN